MNKLTLGIFLSVLVVLLVACQPATPAQPAAPTAPSAPSVSEPTQSAPAASAPAESVGKIKLTKYTATKSGTTATVLVGFQNLQTTQASATVTITLFYARQPVANQTINVMLGPSETKDFMIPFENYPQFNGFYVEGPAIANPLNR